MDNNLFKKIEEEDNSILARCVVRLRTAYWNDDKGIYKKQSITFLKKLSFKYSILPEDCKNIGPEIIDKIENLHECKDGIYEVDICNQQYDWESGFLDDYDYRLIPYKIEKNA